MKNLKVVSKVNKAELEGTVTKAEEITEDTLNKAVKKARDAFAKALEDAKAVLENADASQEEVNEAAKKLEEAIKGLDVLKGDTTVLDAKLAEIEKLDEDKYTTESWAALMAKVEETKGLNRENATQEDVDQVVAELEKAVKALEEKVVIDPDQPVGPTDPEKPTEKPTEKPAEKPTTKPEDKKDDTVKTGDSTMIAGMFALMTASAVVYISLKRKKA